MEKKDKHSFDKEEEVEVCRAEDYQYLRSRDAGQIVQATP